VESVRDGFTRVTQLRTSQQRRDPTCCYNFTIRQQVCDYNELWCSALRAPKIRLIKAPDLGLQGVEFQPVWFCPMVSLVLHVMGLGSFHIWYGSGSSGSGWTPPPWILQLLGRPMGHRPHHHLWATRASRK
jgi:hypothetical protein